MFTCSASLSFQKMPLIFVLLLATKERIVVTMGYTQGNALMEDVVGCQHSNKELHGAFMQVIPNQNNSWTDYTLKKC